MPDSTTGPVLRAAIYARVSSEEQREGQTIDSQVSELERFIHEKRWAIAGIYKDEGWSGALLSRPALDRLRDDAGRKQFDIVLLNDVDRLARDVAHLGIVKRDLEKRGVRVVFRKLPSDESPTYNLMVNVLGSFAEFEREMIADRTRRGRRYKVENRQQFLGSLASYGYRYVPKDKASGQEGSLAVVSEEAAIVRQMYEWVDREALSARQVVTRLNSLKARPRKGGRWAKSTVLRILRNETYAGVWHYNKHYSSEPLRRRGYTRYQRGLKNSCRLRPRTEWLPVILPTELRIVPRDLWQRVQQQLTKNTVFSPRNAKHAYLLKGLVQCGGCGAAYVGDPCHGKYYYRCLSRCKRMPTVKEEHLDEIVWGALSEAILNPATITKQVEKLHKNEDEKKSASSQEIRNIKRALEQLRKEEARVLEAYRTEIITPLQLGHELEQLKQRRGALEVREASLRNNANAKDSNSIRRTLEEYCQLAAERLQTFNEAERQRFLRLLVDVVIFEGKQIRIRAVIPLNDSETERWPTAGLITKVSRTVRDGNMATDAQNDSHNSARIENIAMHFSDRNSVGSKDRIEDTAVDSYSPNSVRDHHSLHGISEGENLIDHISFEIFKALPQKPFSILSDEGLELVRLLKQEQRDPTLQELCNRVREERGIEVSMSHMGRALRRLNLATMRRGPRPKVYKKVA